MKAKKRYSMYIAAVLLLLFAAGCAVTDFDRSADFTQYHSFAWGKPKVNVENPVHRSDLISKNIRTTVENEFAKRGIVRNDKHPDFVVSYQTFTERKQENMNGGYYGYPYAPFYPYRFGWGWGMMPYGYGWGAPPRSQTVTEGTLIIDITDSKTKELVWRGTVKGNIDNVSSLQKQIRKGIKAILKKYPVTPQEPLRLNDDVVS